MREDAVREDAVLEDAVLEDAVLEDAVLEDAVLEDAVLEDAVLEDAVLSVREQAVVLAVADAYYPPHGPIPISGTEAGLLPYFDAYVRRSAHRQRFLIRLLLLFIQLSPLLFGPRRRRFTRLSHTDRLRFLDGAFTSRIYFRRVSFVSLRAVMTMAYLADPGVARHMGMVSDNDPFGLGRSASAPADPVSDNGCDSAAKRAS